MNKIVKKDREQLKWEKKEKQKQEMKKQMIINFKQCLLDWNFELGENKSNKFMTITCVIKKWEQEYNRETDKTDKEKRNALTDDLNSFWNNGYKIGEGTIKFYDFIAGWLLEIAINELYDDMTIDYEYGDRSLYPTLADKLDFIYYKQAEKEFIKIIKKNNLEKKKKKRKRLVIID